MPTAEELDLSTAIEWGQPSAFVANRGQAAIHHHPTQHVSKSFLANMAILSDDWSDPVQPSDFAMCLTYDTMDPALLSDITPHALAARASKYNDDNPSWTMVMNGPYQEEFWKAMESELHTLEVDMQAWDLVQREPDMNVLPSTWAFKIKRFPDGLVKKFKARFCVRGDCQQEGVDFFETWSPVAQWSTIRVVMVLAAKLKLVSAQYDITAAFLLAKLPPTEHIYVHQPRGFNRAPGHVYKLKRSQYGLKQAPRYFFNMLSSKIQGSGCHPSLLDPCLFFSSELLVITYVDDLLVYGTNQQAIDASV